MRSQRRTFRYKLEWLGLTLAAKIVPLFPRSVCLFLAKIFGGLASIFDRQGRQVALENLELALGDQLSESERRRVMRASFQHFAQTMIDLLWSPRLTRENFQQFIELENFEEMSPASIGPEQSLIMACYHYSNFEWLSLACGFLGLPGTIIVQEFKNSALDPIFQELREQSGHEMIPRERGIVRLYKVMRRKGRTALLADLTVPPRQGAVAIDCFGLKTSVTSAHVWLHQQTGAAIIPAHCQPLPNGRYRVVFHPKLKDTAGMTPQQMAQACWNSFEPYVRANPAPWLWMYKHWRYKPRHPERTYPSYAQSWNAFERILAAADPAYPAAPRPSEAEAG